jgi:NAD+ synthase (glutamine-hydrolysing)
VTVVRIGIGQINTRVGDFAGNVGAIKARIKEAARLGVELMVFPEMAVTGYPLADLAFQSGFVAAAGRAMEDVAKSLARSKMTVIVGGTHAGDELYNGAAVIHQGKILGWAHKRYLFCCGWYTEDRYFSAGERPLVIETDKFRAVVTLGEDMGYPVFPGEIELLINLWNEPYIYGKRALRDRMMLASSKEDAVAIAMASPVGGNDDMVFEGSSAIADGFGEVIARGPGFEEALVVADLDLRVLKAHRQHSFPTSHSEEGHLQKVVRVQVPLPWPEVKRPAKITPVREHFFKGAKELFMALALATRDFVDKNGSTGAIVGVSGGIDSALALAIAAEALGPERVSAVSMPGPHNCAATRADARKVAKNLGVKFREVPITPALNALTKGLAPAFKGLKPDVTEENLQARVRGVILMALANKHRAMVLATGNKSERATGYCTLYGDTVGAFAPLTDVYKTQVYEIASWYNKRAGRDVIPASTVARPPTAELKPNQTDQDTLPPYPELDRILARLLEGAESPAELSAAGEDPETVAKVAAMLMNSEFKRRQGPLGPTVSERPLKDLVLPITKK